MDRLTSPKTSLRKKTTAKERPFLPDEIITTHILIRLPSKSAIRCRLVCKKWRDFIVSRGFIDLHQRSSIPVILVAASRDYTELDLYMLDKWWEFARARFLVLRFPFYPRDYSDASEALFSHAGLLVLNECPVYATTFVILNPARPRTECVKVALCSELRKSGICSVYYHPLLKEYCTLLKIDKSRSKPVEYMLLNLGSNPSMRAVRNPFNYRVKDKDVYPLFINDHLYWLLESEQEAKFSGRNDILEFDIISEDFVVLHCPVPLNTECKKHQTHLMNSNGVLSFLLILPNAITVWNLEDHAQQLWTTNTYATSIEVGCWYDKDEFHVLAFVEGMLAFREMGRLYVYNLKEGTGTMKNYPKGKYKGDMSFLSHQMSLASLKNCKSNLYIDKDGKVLV